MSLPGPVSTAPAAPYSEWGQMLPNYPQPSYEQLNWLHVPTVMRYGIPPQYGAAPPQFPDLIVAGLPPTVPYAGTSGAQPRSITGGVLPRGQDVTGYYVSATPPRVPTAGDPYYT